MPSFLENTNKKELMQLIVTAVLVVIFSLLVKSAFINQSVKQTDGKLNFVQAHNTPQVGEHQREILSKLNQEIGSLELTRDPFFEAPKEVVPVLVLNGILWDKEDPMAIINDTVVQIGDIIDGNTVIDITENSVTLTKDQNTFELQLKFLPFP